MRTRLPFFLACVLAAHMASAWSIRDEGYSCTTAGMTLAELQSAGITLVSHVPCTREWMDEAAKYGIRGMPYISLYKVYDLKAPGANPEHPFWGAVAMNEHPEWVYIGRDGTRARPFNNPFYPKVNWQSCTNTAGIADAYCRGAAGVMKTGAGGVFIDNVLPAPICYGPTFGVHKHLYPDKDNVHSFKIALRRVQDTVRSFGESSVMMINVGRWAPWQDFADCIMLESFIYNVDVRPGPGGWVGTKRIRVKRWPQIHKFIQDTAAYVDGRGCIVTLEYLPRSPEAAHYTYACAKLANYLWSGSMPVRRDVIRTLHRLRFQRPTGPLHHVGGVAYRHYPGGLAAVNTWDTEATVALPVPSDAKRLADVWASRLATVRGGYLHARIPPDAGRLYIVPERLADGHLREALVALQTAAEAHAGQPDKKLNAAIEATRAARKAPAAPTLAALCRTVAACGQPASGDTLSLRLAKGAKLSRDEVRRLMAAAAPSDPPTCDVGKDKVTLAAGGLRWEIGGGRALVIADGMGVNCGIAIGGLKDVHGWQAPDKILGTRMLANTADAKAVEITMGVGGTKSRQTIPGVQFVLVAEARRGEPGLRLRSIVRNTGDKPIACYTTWSSYAAGTWCSRPGEPTIQADRYVNFARTAWTYMHPSEQGGKGLVLITDLRQSTSPYAWNIYSEPRSGKLAPGQERKIDFALYAVPAAWHEDPRAMGAFLRAHVYASRACRLAANTDVSLQAEGEPIAGRTTRVSLAGGAARKPKVTGAALLTDKGALIPAAGLRIDGNAVSVHTPPSLREEQYLQVVVRYAEKGADGAAVPLAEFVDVQPRPSLSLRLRPEPATWDGRSGRAAVLVQNHLDRAATCRLSLEAPHGYTVPKPVAITLEAGQEQPVQVTIAAPRHSAAPQDAKAVLCLAPRGTAGQCELPLRFLPQLPCPRLPTPPAIDGKLDDDAWEHAATTTPFRLVRDGAEPKEPTVALVGYDATRLYAAFRCSESQMKGLVARTPPEPGVSNRAVHADDSVEVFLSPGRDGKYVQLAANSRGAQRMSKPIPWQVAAAKGKDAWTVEVAIELSSLGGAPKPGTMWAVNFCRMQQRLKQASAWSPTGRGFHRPDRFGLLVFGK